MPELMPLPVKACRDCRHFQPRAWSDADGICGRLLFYTNDEFKVLKSDTCNEHKPKEED